MSGQIDDGGAVHPWTRQIRCGGVVEDTESMPGMSLRDWFAGQVLAQIGNGYFARGEVTQQSKDHAMVLAAHAYNIADAMIAARKGGAK